jgi:hypothetical protein
MLWAIGAAVSVVGALLAMQPLLNARIAGAAGLPSMAPCSRSWSARPPS